MTHNTQNQRITQMKSSWLTQSWQTYYEKWQRSTAGLLTQAKRQNRKVADTQPIAAAARLKAKRTLGFSKLKFASATVGSLMLLSSIAPTLHAGTITVNEATIGGGATCDIVEAIHAANGDMDNDCTGTDNNTTVNDADTILFNIGSADTINLTASSSNSGNGDNGLPVITSTITLDGGTGGITITRNTATAFRILEVDGQGGNGGKLTLNKMTIHNGSNAIGGGLLIQDRAALTLTDSTIASNTATNGGGGIYADTNSPVTVNSSTIAFNTATNTGGGISASSSPVTVNNSTIVSNNAIDGGGILAISSPVTVDNSTIDSNTANNGGGILASFFSVVTVDNSTIASNTANLGGGIYSYYSTPVTVTNSRLLTNTAGTQGGALYNHSGNVGAISIEGSCVVANSANAIHNGNSPTSTVTAQSNWWGAPDGPGVVLSGSGDTVSADVDGSNFLTTAILNCPGILPEIEMLGNSIVITDGATLPSTNDDTDFGSSAIGTPVVKTFTINNSGSFTLTLNSPITVTGSTDFVVTTPPALTSIPAGDSTTFAVTFTPTVTSPVTATITIGNDDTDEHPYNFVVQGQGPSPEIEVLGNSIVITDGATIPSTTDNTDFGSSIIGTPVVKTFTISNSGAYTLSLSGPITVTGSSDFVVTTPPALSSIPAGDSTTFAVTFTPTVTSPVTATIAIGNDDSNEDPYNFIVQGAGAVDVDATATAQASATSAAATATANANAVPPTATFTPYPTATHTPTPTPTPSAYVTLGPATMVVNEGVGTLSLNLLLNKVLAVPVDVTLGSLIQLPDYATAAVDYDAINQAITFAPGETFKSITVAIHQDAIQEPNEQFRVIIDTVSGGAVAQIGADESLITIVDDDASTATPTVASTEAPTETATPMDSATPTATSTVPPTATSTATSPVTSVPTDTPLPTATATMPPTAVSTDMPLPTATATPLPTATAIPLPEDTATSVPTDTPLPVATATLVPADTPAPMNTATAVPTDALLPTATVTAMPTDTLLPTATAMAPPTDTPSPTTTVMPGPTDIPVPTNTATAQSTDTPLPTATATVVPMDTPGLTNPPTAVPTGTATAMPTDTATVVPNATDVTMVTPMPTDSPETPRENPAVDPESDSIADPADVFDPAGPTPESVDEEADPTTGEVNDSRLAGLIFKTKVRSEENINDRNEVEQIASDDVAIFVISIENNTSNPFYGIVIRIVIPSNATFRQAGSGLGQIVAASINDNQGTEWELADLSGPCTDGAPSGTECIFRLGTVRPGERDEVSLPITINEDARANTQIELDTTLVAASLDQGLLISISDEASVEVVAETPTSLDQNGEPLWKKVFLPLINR